jgi:predicted GTPase
LQRELICTASELPMTIELNETNFVEMLSQADKKQSSIKVSFLGDTGSGKSLTVMQLLSFDDRIRYGRSSDFF